MIQAKFTFEEKQLEFINNYAELGFKDKSSLVRSAIEKFIKDLDQQKLAESAEVYAEIYKNDKELRELTNSAMNDWPEK